MSRSHLILAVFLLVLVAPLSLAAQTTERVRVQPRTVWAQRGKAVMRDNAALLRTAQPHATVALSGTMRQVMVPVAFVGEPLRYSAAEFSQRFYGTSAAERYSLPAYFDEMSAGTFTIAGEVTTSVQLTRTSASYTGARSPNLYNGVADDLPNFLRDVLEAADRVVDWRRFIDAGRTVPAVIIVTAGRGGHCPGDATHIWPHRWHLSGLFGAPFETSSRTTAGETILIDDYIIQPSEECAGGLSEVGVLAHETGHLLGLPDLYNTRDGGATSPVGHWDLMATGNYNRPSSPAALGAWSRTQLGWAEVMAPNSADSGWLSLPPVLTSHQVLRLPLGNGGEYVLVENRRRSGTDQHLHGEGLLFWAVDPQTVAERLPTNTLNDDLDAPAVAVLPADMRRDLEENVNDGDETDVWADVAFVNGFGFGTNREIVGRHGAANWSLTELAWSPGMVANVMLRFFPDSAALSILPDALGPFMVGTRIDIQLRTEPPMSATWAGDTVQLNQLGLELDEAGRLHGTLTDSPGTYDLTIQARVTQDRLATQSWTIRIVPRRTFDSLVVVQALLGGSGLDVETLELLDALGNRNGLLDVGDVVVAVRAGLLDTEALMKVTP